ncbi:hypothetical protein VPH35_089954 [Triticum aestivum]
MGFQPGPRNNSVSFFSHFSSCPIVSSPNCQSPNLSCSRRPEHAGDRIRRAGSPETTDPHRVVVRIMNKGSIHKKETHGTSDDISENTPVEKVRGPNLFERTKEEIEALVAAVHDKMEHHSSPRGKEGGNLLKLKSFCLI